MNKLTTTLPLETSLDPKVALSLLQQLLVRFREVKCPRQHFPFLTNTAQSTKR